MAKIRHLALITIDAERLAKFYQEVFDMKITHSQNGAFFLSDGYITLALLPNKAEGKPNGLNHFDFQIDDQEEMAKRLADFGIGQPAKRPADRPYAETRSTDPDGNNFDLSVHGFEAVEFAKQREVKEKELV